MADETQRASRNPTLLRYTVTSENRPSIREALVIGDRVRKALIRWSDGADVFVGRDTRTNVLSEGHGHAHVFSECVDGDGEISHLSVYAPNGFDRQCRSSAALLHTLWGPRRDDYELMLSSTLRDEDLATGALGEGTDIFGESRVWTSATPFIGTRHAKYTKAGQPKMDDNGLVIGSDEHDLRRLLKEQGFPPLVRVTPVDELVLAQGRMPWSAFYLRREGGGTMSQSARPRGFQLEFESPVRGPIAVGYGAHFGLGLFRRERSTL